MPIVIEKFVWLRTKGHTDELGIVVISVGVIKIYIFAILHGVKWRHDVYFKSYILLAVAYNFHVGLLEPEFISDTCRVILVF